MISEPGIDLITAHDRAECGGADADVVLPHRAPLVHGVEGGDPTDIGRRQAQDLGTGFNAGWRHPALDALHQVQHGQQRRPRLRISLRNRAQLLHGGLGDLCLGQAVIETRLIEMRDEVPVADKLLRRNIPAGMPVGSRGLWLDQLAHRSTPPITGSSDATATTTSETIAPSHITGMACRLVKLGSRK